MLYPTTLCQDRKTPHQHRKRLCRNFYITLRQAMPTPAWQVAACAHLPSCGEHEDNAVLARQLTHIIRLHRDDAGRKQQRLGLAPDALRNILRCRSGGRGRPQGSSVDDV